MKFEIINDIKEKEKTLEFWVEKGNDGMIILKARVKDNPNSYRWNVIAITPDGFLRRGTSIPDGLGIKLTEKGQIMEDNE